MSLISEILEHNREFVAKREYEALRTDRFPNKKLVVLACMDTRLVELLPRAMALRNGDVKMVKNAGAIVSHPFGSVMRSILMAVYELEASEVAVIGHYGCAMTGLNSARIMEKVRARGIGEDVLATLKNAGIDLEKWLTGFTSVEAGVRESVAIVKNHPLLPRGVFVHGLLMDPETGKLDWIVDGYNQI